MGLNPWPAHESSTLPLSYITMPPTLTPSPTSKKRNQHKKENNSNSTHHRHDMICHQVQQFNPPPKKKTKKTAHMHTKPLPVVCPITLTVLVHLPLPSLFFYGGGGGGLGGVVSKYSKVRVSFRTWQIPCSVWMDVTIYTVLTFKLGEKEHS